MHKIRFNDVHITPSIECHRMGYGKYGIHLPDKYRVGFANRVHACDWLINLGKQMSFNLYQYNQLYMQVLTHYRQIYFYIKNYAPYLEHLKIIDIMFERIPKRAPRIYAARNAINDTYADMYMLGKEMMELSAFIKAVYKSRSETGQVYAMRGVIEQITLVQTRVKQLGYDQAVALGVIYNPVI